MKQIRKIVIGGLCVISLWLLSRAANAPPEPGYGRIAFIGYGLIIFTIWIPYIIFSMFLDGNKRFGFISLGIACLTGSNIALAIVSGNKTWIIIAWLYCPISFVCILGLSIMNSIKRRKQNQRLHSIAGSARSE